MRMRSDGGLVEDSDHSWVHAPFLTGTAEQEFYKSVCEKHGVPMPSSKKP